MEISIPKAVKTLELGEYIAEWQGKTLDVWVNPPATMIDELVRMMQKIDQVVKRATKKRQNWLSKRFNGRAVDQAEVKICEIFSQLLSQGKDVSKHLSAADVEKIIHETFENDPAFWPWLQNKIVMMIHEHRSSLKKVYPQHCSN